MEETRRGFLKSAIAAGSLIVPFGSKKPEVVEEERIIELPVSQNEKILDLGDCLVIPKSHIKSYEVNYGWSEYPYERCSSVYKKYERECVFESLNQMSLTLEVFTEENLVINSVTNLNDNKGQVILPYGTLEY